MAYHTSTSFNPDTLPIHPQPDEAAEAIAGARTHRQSSPKPQSRPQQVPSRRPVSTSPPAIPGAHQPQYRPNPAPANPQYPPRHESRPDPRQDYYQQSQNPYSNPHTQPQSISSALSSPPTNYGWPPRQNPPAPPPNSRHPSHPAPASSYPPRTPAPPDPDSADLLPIFRAANLSRSGSLSAHELGSALVNSDYSPFDPLTIRTMMRLFSSHPQHSTINYPEFQDLYRFLAAWRDLFERFDEDRSGRISLTEFSKALVAFGYKLSQTFVGVIYTAFQAKPVDEHERRGSRPSEGMSFDLFVQACISLKRMTESFKRYDDDRDGYIMLSFEEFLTEILTLRE